MQRIPLVDLQAQYLTIKALIDREIDGVIKKSAFILGEYVERFEDNFARFCGAKFCAGVNSGTDALILSLRALGISSGDEVVTVPNTFIATAEAIASVGAKIVFVDVERDSGNIDVTKIKAKLTSRTMAVIAVHLYGQSANLGPLLDLASKYNLHLLEDAAQAHGAQYRGRRVGTFGAAGAFSFYPGKNLGAYGDGGCVVTDDETIYKQIKMLRNHGRLEKYEHIMEGGNSRLDGLQAAILDVKLKFLEDWNTKRRDIAGTYNKRLGAIKEIILPPILGDVDSVYHLYVIKAKKRDELKRYLFERGIETGIHYPIPLHLQKAYAYLGYKRGDFPAAEERSEEILSLPLYPEMTQEQLFFIAKNIENFYS